MWELLIYQEEQENAQALGLRILFLCEELERDGRASKDQIEELRQQAHALLHPQAMGDASTTGALAAAAFLGILVGMGLLISWLGTAVG